MYWRIWKMDLLLVISKSHLHTSVVIYKKHHKRYDLSFYIWFSREEQLLNLSFALSLAWMLGGG